MLQKKLSGFDGVAVIDNKTSRDLILHRMDVADVWGVGSKIAKRLKFDGIHNAAQLAQQNPKKIRKQFSVVTERTVNELNGLSCLSWDEVKSPKKEVFSTRSFGQRVTTRTELREALVAHAAIVGKKVRRQSSLIQKLMVFASSSPHDEGYYKQAIVYSFVVATDNTCKIAHAITQMIDSIYRHGVKFYRCGVGAIELTSKNFIQPDLFMPDHYNSNLMKCLDNINPRYGDGALKIATEGRHQKWHMRREFLSPQYTSQWRDIPKIKC
jgi:DNA polymerase V